MGLPTTKSPTKSLGIEASIGAFVTETPTKAVGSGRETEGHTVGIGV